MRYKIYCEAPADRDALVTILAKNGYTVRIGKEQKTKNSRYTYYIEYWREDRDRKRKTGRKRRMKRRFINRPSKSAK